MWDRNFFLGDNVLSLKAVEDLLSGATRETIMRRPKIDRYIESYSEWIESKGDQIPEIEALALANELDGSYWNEIQPRKK